LAFFDVLSWGYGAYVYLHVTAPSGQEIQKFEAESEGRVEFVASEDGEYSFCFKNAYTETEVSFWINTETDSALSDVAKEGKLLIGDNDYSFIRDAIRASRLPRGIATDWSEPPPIWFVWAFVQISLQST